MSKPLSYASVKSPYLDRKSLFRIVGIVYFLWVAFFFIHYFRHINGLNETFGTEIVGRDYINFWTGGQQLWDRGTDHIYDHTEYNALLEKNFGSINSSYAFSYPPHILYLLAPFALFGYLPALILWSLGGLIAYISAVRQFFSRKMDWFILALAPATLICLIGGQSGLFTAALFIGGYSLKNKRPIMAGILFGLLTVKPQMGVLLALVLLLDRDWRVILSAVLTTFALITASIVMFSAELWSDFISETLPYQAELISNSIGIFDHMVPTAYKYMINLGAGTTIAWVIHGVVMVYCVAAVVWGCLRFEDNYLKLALLCVLTSVFSPYMAVYDLALFSFGALISASFAVQNNHDWRAHPLLWLILLASPFLTIIASMYQIPLGFIASLGLSFLILSQLNNLPRKLRQHKV